MPLERACSLDDLWEGEMKEVDVGGTSVLVVHAEGGHVAAFEPWCPHQQMPLADGDLEGRLLTCSAHRWEFDAVTGMGVNPDECALTRYLVEVNGDDVFVDVSVESTGDTASLSD